MHVCSYYQTASTRSTMSWRTAGLPQGAATVSNGEGRGEQMTKRHSDTSRDAELDQGCPPPLSRLTEMAQEDPTRKFSSIAHFSFAPGVA